MVLGSILFCQKQTNILPVLRIHCFSQQIYFQKYKWSQRVIWYFKNQITKQIVSKTPTNNMQAEESEEKQIRKHKDLKLPQKLHDKHNAQFIYSNDKSRHPEKNYHTNAEIPIKAESLRYLQQFISQHTQDKKTINAFVANSSIGCCSISTAQKKLQDNTQAQTLSQNELSTMEQIQQARKTQESTTDDSNNKQLNESNQKEMDKLNSQIQNNKKRLMKTLFTYFFEAFSATQVIIRSNVFKRLKKDGNSLEKEKIFQKQTYKMTDDNNIYHAINIDEIMYPPVVCQNDFIYTYDPSPFPNTSLFQLNKTKDIYQTDKPTCMLRLQLTIKDLFIVIYKLTEEIAETRNIDKSNLLKDNIKRKITKQISNIDGYVISYQTQTIIFLMCDYVIDTLSQKQPQQSKRSQKSSCSAQQQQLFNIQSNALDYSLEFLSKLSFYNFIVGLYDFQNKRDIPIQIFMGNKFEGSFVDMKTEFFSKTIKNPILLMRIFNESASHNVARSISQQIPAHQFDMFKFYKQKFCPINSQQEMIDMYIKYQCNFMIFGSEIVIDLIDGENLLFKEIFNYSRFLTSNFLGHFLIKTLKIIDNQINQCHTNFFYKRFQDVKKTDQRWNQNFNKIKERIESSMKKIYEYLNPPKDKQLTTNSKFIQTESKELLNFFQQVNNLKTNENKTIQEEIKDIKLTHKYMTEIFDKSFFQKDLFRKFFQQLTKNLEIKNWHFSEFLQWNMPMESNLQSKKSIEEFLRKYKIGQISILKLFNMFRTLHLYSFANRIQFEQLRKMDAKSGVIPRKYEQVLNKLDMLFINLASRKRIATVFMNAKQTSDFQINQNFDIEYKLAKMINDLYIKYNETTNQAYLETALEYENQKFQNYLFIPTKSCASLNKNRKEPYMLQIQQQSFIKATTKSTGITLSLTEELRSQSDQFIKSFNQIQSHPYFRLLMQKQNFDSNYNFNINCVMNKHIHRSRLSIFPPKLTKQFIQQINENLLFFSQGHKIVSKEQRSVDDKRRIKQLQSQINNRLDTFANHTLNKSVQDLFAQRDTKRGNFLKKQNYDNKPTQNRMDL